MIKRLGVVLAAVMVAGLVVSAPSSAAPAPLSVTGNRITANGTPVQLLGVTHSSWEYACAQGWGFHSGTWGATQLDRIKAYGMNHIRIGINEACWLGISGAPAAYSGANYQNKVAEFVTRANTAGLWVAISLFWARPGTDLPSNTTNGLQPMPNQDHSPALWTSVANKFKTNDTVVFVTYEEPWPDSGNNSDEAWRCWRDGGTCGGISYQAAGQQSLVTAIRDTGATNVIALGGVSWANALGRWAEHKPVDPLNKLVASLDIYNGQVCSSAACFDSQIKPLTLTTPVLVGEHGNTTDPNWHTMIWDRFDSNNVSYSAWNWNDWSEHALLTNQDAGTLSAWGERYVAHVQARSAAPTPTPTPSPTPTPPGVSLVTQAQTTGAFVTTRTIAAFNPGADANRHLIVTLAFVDAISAVSVQYGGVALTLVPGTKAGGTLYHTEMWELVNPSSTPANIVATWTGQTKIVMTALAFTGVDQTTPTRNGASGTNGTTPSKTIVSAPGHMTLDVVQHTATLSAPTQTQRWINVASSGSFRSSGSTSAEGDAAVTHAWTSSTGDNNSQSIVDIVAFVPPTPTPTPPPTGLGGCLKAWYDPATATWTILKQVQSTMADC